MAKVYYDVLSPRPTREEGKTFFHKIGRMQETSTGEGFMVYLDSLPIPGADGSVKMLVRQARPREEYVPRQPAAAPAAPPPQPELIDDDIPF